MKISTKPTKVVDSLFQEGMVVRHTTEIRREKPNKPNPKLAAALAAIHKKYGAEALTTVVGGRPVPVKGIKTQWQALDDLLTGDVDEKNRTIPGTGVGLPRGRIIEISGLESSGKSTTVLHLICAVQKAGGTAVYIDAEHSFDPKYAAALGVDLATLQMCQPDSAEQGLDVAVDLAKSGAVDFIAIDSVSALVPEAENDTDMGKQHMGLQARLMGKALRKITAPISRSGCVLVFVNQVRMKIGMVFGNPEVTSGGNALKFYASIRLDIRKVKTLKKGDKNIGIRSRIKVVKNKCAPPFRELFVDLLPGKGIVVVHSDPDLGEPP